MSHIMTVRGPIRPEDLGPTMMHEHIFKTTNADFWDPSEMTDPEVGRRPIDASLGGLARWHGTGFLDDVVMLPDADYDLLVEEVGHYKACGGSCLVELSVEGIEPAPLRVRDLSEEVDLHVVAGLGFYVHAVHPPWVDNASVEELTDYFLKQLHGGLLGTDVRPGIVGEIGTSEEIYDCEIRVLQAAGRAGVATGTTVNVHCHPPALEVTLRIIDTLIGEGLPADRVYLSHLDEIMDLDYHTQVLERGVVTGFDSFGQDGHFTPTWKSRSDLEKMQMMVALIDRGFEDQLVVAQDIGRKRYMRCYGGMGYDHVIERVMPRMKKFMGVSQAAIDKALVGTPRRLLTRDGDAWPGLFREVANEGDCDESYHDGTGANPTRGPGSDDDARAHILRCQSILGPVGTGRSGGRPAADRRKPSGAGALGQRGLPGRPGGVAGQGLPAHPRRGGAF